MLLKRIGYIPDEIDAPDIDEVINHGEEPGPYVIRMARSKAEIVSRRHKNSYIIAADTVIYSGAKIHGKASNKEEALKIFLVSGLEVYCSENGTSMLCQVFQIDTTRKGTDQKGFTNPCTTMKDN